MDKANICIATPCYGGMMSAYYTNSIINLMKDAIPKGYKIDIKTIGNESLVQRARNNLVDIFLSNSDYTHLFFIDADIGFHYTSIYRLVNENKDVAVGLYPMKDINWKYVKDTAQNHPDKPLEQFSLNYVINFVKKGQQIHNVNNHCFVELETAGTGFMCIKRNVFIRMREKYPNLTYRCNTLMNNKIERKLKYAFFHCDIDPNNEEYMSEDYYFCKKWRSMGGKIWGDIKTDLTHFGNYAFKGSLQCFLEETPQ